MNRPNMSAAYLEQVGKMHENAACLLAFPDLCALSPEVRKRVLLEAERMLFSSGNAGSLRPAPPGVERLLG